ncbi:MAG: acyl-ACP--UDP-N-acetylglucosamine O-acyltransferase [Planctomycetota bacterium]|jgi:UDP-N-acetylglucosamine acyltransferase
MTVSSQAVVGPNVELADGVEVGPFAVIDGHVRIGAGTRVYPHAYVTGFTTIGAGCQIHPGAVVGHLPQDVKFDDVRSYTHIGNGTIVREGASIHRGTEAESTTTLGRNCFLMANSHVGHNCTVDDDVIVANGALLSGHVTVGAAAFVSGNSTVHQFVRIGRRAMIGGLSRVEQDVPPFLTLVPSRGLIGVNRIGVQRAGMDPASIRELGQLYKLLFRKGLPLAKAVAQAESSVSTSLQFCVADSRRGIDRGPR